MVRTNLVVNPSFEVNITDGWNNFGTGTITRTRDATNSQFGSASYKMDTNAISSDGGMDTNFTLPAAIYRLSGYIKTQNATGDAKLVLRNRNDFNADINLTLNNSIASRPFTRVTGTFTVPTSGSYDIVMGIGPYGSPGTGIAWFDGIMLEAIALVGDDVGYFDGSTTDTALIDYAWTGTAHFSTSTATDIVPTKGGNLGLLHVG